MDDLIIVQGGPRQLYTIFWSKETLSVFPSMIPDFVHFWLWTILMDELETAQIQHPINKYIKSRRKKKIHMISRVCKLSVKLVFIHGPPSHAIEAIFSDKIETSLRPMVYYFAIFIKLIVLLTSPGCKMCARIPKNITIDNNIHESSKIGFPWTLLRR